MKLETLDDFRAFGAQAREGANKLYRRPVPWEIFRKMFGWFQHRKKNNYTDEQLAAFEDGYRNFKIVREPKKKKCQA